MRVSHYPNIWRSNYKLIIYWRDFYISSKQIELFGESKMDANKKVEVNEAFIAEWQKHECLWDVKARAYKDRNAGENACSTLAELFEMSGKKCEKYFFLFIQTHVERGRNHFYL